MMRSSRRAAAIETYVSYYVLLSLLVEELITARLLPFGVGDFGISRLWK